MNQFVNLQFSKEEKISWKIFVGKGILERLAELAGLSKYTQVVIITDKEVEMVYRESLIHSLKGIKKFTIISVPSGEETKSLTEVKKIYTNLIRLGFDRFGVIVAFGGGVIGDLAGFVAATFLRGVDFIQVPTTLLAQVDAAIGGKNGVNFLGSKNIIGTIYQPRVIISDVALLTTLSKRQLVSGLAEVVKYGLIVNPKIVELLEKKSGAELSLEDLEKLVVECSKIKSEIVLSDERDKKGKRIILNFGHTLGHAIEAEFKGTLTHGEAIAVGMIFSAHLSKNLGYLTQHDIARIVNLIEKLGLPTKVNLDKYRILSRIAFDKKRKGDKIKFVVLKKIGKACVEEVEIGFIEQSLSYVLKV